MHKQIILGFTGEAGAGKTTAAGSVTEDVLSFATPLKETVAGLFDLEPYQLLTQEGKNSIDERYGVTPRKIMQRFGTEFVRYTVPDLWLIKMRDEIERHPGALVICVDDVRFDDEAHLIRDLGGFIVKVYGRNSNIGTEHASEKGVGEHLLDFSIDNSGEFYHLRAAVFNVLCSCSHLVEKR